MFGCPIRHAQYACDGWVEEDAGNRWVFLFFNPMALSFCKLHYSGTFLLGSYLSSVTSLMLKFIQNRQGM
jgi:hypothetical protein